MEDKQIIELFLERSDKAIPKTEEKYGQYTSYITRHILQDESEAERCVRECYELLWESIPPHRPQNLKAYLCKITRNHALQMKYSVANPEIDLFSAELVIYDFLKNLEVEQRKLFIARYWYMSLVSEIAIQYKVDASKVEKEVLLLHQKLNERLAEKKVHLQSEADLLFAMTEIDDHYLTETEPFKTQYNETDTNAQNTKTVFFQLWQKYQISMMACVLLVVFILFAWPKTAEVPLPNGIENESETELKGPDKITIVDPLDFVIVNAGDIMTEEDFDEQKKTLPWTGVEKLAALPIYKNLSYTGALGVPVYLDEDTLFAMAEDVASKLDTEIIESRYLTIVDDAGPVSIYGIVASTGLGSIEIDGRGSVCISFDGGFGIPSDYAMSDSASKEAADSTVDYLLSYFQYKLSFEDMVADSYATYALNGNRQMHYRAIGTKNGMADVEEYYFNQVHFYLDEQKGLISMRYGDCRIATEDLGFYPLMSLQEAKACLQEGKYETVEEKDFVFDDANIRRIELMYRLYSSDEYYQPYYCFYMLLEDGATYGKFYVPAAQGGEAYGIPTEPEVKIWDMSDYEKMASEFVYHKDGKYYTVGAGKIIEGDQNELLAYKSTGQVEVEHLGTVGAVTYFYYGDSEVLNLDEVMAGKNYNSLGAMYIDGTVLILSVEYINNTSHDMATTCYLYSLEDGSLIQTIESTPSRVNELGEMGLIFYGDQYATNVNSDGNVEIMDAITGSRYSTGIYYRDVSYICSAGEQHLAIVYTNGEIAIVEKSSGQIIKKSKFKVDFQVNGILYKDDLLYVETWTGGNYVFVISEFE